ncbi:phage terminase small subunit [Moritella sp. F3]|uniref:phage terminase small subunit n=1 Tax=Moritella sp. F3 TaxID=2718882 RepID=UPI0018E1ACAB|nr:phage terminase small subunit [Moritella sp. F3]GIC79506.1 hypothetical protein FMO001_42330 [Moritella sp. F1]GIC79784.1 hypothetical protein FMO003_00650 [Moritella sp. F3]
MLSILIKRKARARKKQENEDKPIQSDILSIKSSGKQRVTLEDKPWSEVQNTLKRDLEYSRTLAGSQEKIPFKKELIKKYKPLVTKLLATHENLDGLDVVWWFYQWQIDCGLLPLMHDAFKAAVLKGLDTPANWKSNGQTAYCDIVFKYSHEAHKANIEFNTAYLSGAINDLLAGSIATNPPLKVKMFRLAGDLLLQAGNAEDALTLYNVVMKIDPQKGGRKTKVKELKEALGHE